ncbi:MAG: bifunctional diaminohydroxyphosphoribosylaminopyrimidine deaminase/5-amino-6-(5-phosphoribosylamino)uracil reductase RibD [Ignavibacteriales bacterium]|nr:bifunctional diaminohydroxyphosphoribosylaminopyrimidine deaminase/5-amino-6-(5-phosphoribosylamino)uracil reductase RibD [Ignavibacteriales bacterium]
MNDESYIKLTLEIAKKGRGKVSPNPLVGAILVKDEKILGAGYHKSFGSSHAEINAINSAKQNVEDATLYVNLEPCSHFGKTPPCVDAIIEHKIKRVVIGTLDMNPIVSGNGIKKLKQAGVEVKVGILEKECIELNKFFFKFITKKIPYVTLKTAQTLDGKIADKNYDSKWITSIASRKYVHNLRSEYDAVLVGTTTVKIDNPSLTVRYVEGRNPKRVIIDSQLKLKPIYKIFNNTSDGNLIVLTSKNSIAKKKKVENLIEDGVKVLFVKENGDGRLNLRNALEELAKENISSLLVEGGQKIYSTFIKENLFDDIMMFIGPKYLGGGLSVVECLGVPSIKRSIKLKVISVEKVGDDVLIVLNK